MGSTDEYEGYSSLACDAVKSVRQVPVFRCNVLSLAAQISVFYP